jgi:tRNA (guanine-N7-)-methyltransferase
MGRRALRRIDPALDLSGHLKTLDDLPSPWNAEHLFRRRAPLEVEIGSGKGLFLRSASAQRPGVDFLGIEISPKYARFAAAGLAKRSTGNALVVVGDAIRLFAEILPDESLAAVHVYFPDPWWKKRHKRRRVMQEPLALDVQRTLLPGGSLHFWTDVEEYFNTVLTLLAEKTQLQGPLAVPEATPEHEMDYHTHFERRTRLQDQTVYRSEFRKRSP